MIARHCSPAVTRNWMRLSNKFASREKNNNSERENLMKRISLILAFAMLAALTSAAQEKPKTEAPGKTEMPKAEAPKADAKAAALPTVEVVFDNYVKAVGGKEAIEKITSRSMKGSFDLEAFGVAGAPVEMIAKAPNKSAMKIDITGFGVVNRVFDGASGWASDPMSGLRELSGLELAQMKRGSDFYQELNFKKHYTKTEVKGKEKVGSYETYVVEATPTEGSPEKLYFDVNTNLLVRHDAEAESPQGKLLMETYMEDYRVVDGVKVPHTVKQVNPAMTIVIKITEVKNNVEIDDAKFNKPSGN
jgi:zinc protease